ncbi:ABC transporter permease [Spirochaeta dissipatitropha]
MKIRDSLFIARRYIRTRLAESIVVILGLGIGIAVLTGIVSMQLNVRGYSRDYSNMPWFRQITVSPSANRWSSDDGPAIRIGRVGQDPVRLTAAELFEAREMSPDIEYAFVNTMTSGFDFSLPEGGPSGWWDNEAGILLAFPDYFPANNLEIVEGISFSRQDVEEQAPVAIIGNDLAELVFQGASPVGRQIQLNDIPFSIIGVFRDLNQDRYGGFEQDPRWMTSYQLALPYGSESQLWGGTGIGELHHIEFAVADYSRLAAGVEQLTNYFHSKFDPDSIRIDSQLDFQYQQGSSDNAIFRLLGVLTGAGMLIASISSMNLMLARVLRRRRSVGLSMAIGASRRSIFLLFVLEACMLGLSGGLIGGLLTVGFVKLIGFQAELLVFLISMGIAFLASLVFSVYPAILASRVNPAEVQ